MTRSSINPDSLHGADVTGHDGAKLGTVDNVYLDNETHQPEWVAVKSGLFGTHISLVPLANATFEGTALTVPFDKEALKTAPHHDPDTNLSPQEEHDLYEHYGIAYGQHDAPPVDTGHAQHAQPEGLVDESRVQGRDTSGPATDQAMTRSEEQLHVGTEKVQTGVVRLKKYVVTENVTKTVPVSHEEVRLEREPITEANREHAMSGADITEEEHEITLHGEKPVVSKETVPVERVRLGTETVTGEETINESVRKEQIDEPDTQHKPA